MTATTSEFSYLEARRKLASFFACEDYEGFVEYYNSIKHKLMLQQEYDIRLRLTHEWRSAKLAQLMK